ncbi:hypothetical protein FISHEDRAFT_65520 [Fistulina hepatica ATCC 64428]|uniref:Glycosyltransferase 61 catalytic domain-containing protein n=1 Tax=Fistulina hepatica ATCC 64428 TaxID=1128425 RepID=A0A0D7AFI7_9AGAR|nr:hypothetical protein FISHEDRAFT_65520 [Fistulina hepatica ATCC 64428]
MFARSLSPRDVLMIFLGAMFTHVVLFVAHISNDLPIVVQTHVDLSSDLQRVRQLPNAMDAPPLVDGLEDVPPIAPPVLPETRLVHHAPGWTLFENLYMADDTLFVVTSHSSEFPPVRLMTSTGAPAENTPENIAAREPTAQHMSFVRPATARARWADRVWTVEGNTLLYNDPPQFLQHYYHIVAELLFGTWAFWHGAWSQPTPTYTPPHIDRAIFIHADADGWRDRPGFNAYVLRAAFPSMTIEVQEDWADRVAASARGVGNSQRVWRFPVALLADRSAAFRGAICGARNQRTAAEAFEYMHDRHALAGLARGAWWDDVRNAVWRFAVPAPDKIVITYISRQNAGHRKLLPGDHEALVAALKALVRRHEKDGWILNVLEAEKMSKDEQIRIAASTTILLGVHGNGLTHLVFMPPTKLSAVVEIFYPDGFAYDYQWTTNALGMRHFAVWNDTSTSLPNPPPRVNYPPGFQDNEIPVYGPYVAQLVEDHLEGKLL